MLKVWGRKNFINVQKVLWCCEELGLPYERIDAGGPFGLTRDPEYLARNPNALVPTISDDEFVLWESNAIVRYLATRHGSGAMWPEDLRERADAERWMDWQLRRADEKVGTPKNPRPSAELLYGVGSAYEPP